MKFEQMLTKFYCAIWYEEVTINQLNLPVNVGNDVLLHPENYLHRSLI